MGCCTVRRAISRSNIGLLCNDRSGMSCMTDMRTGCLSCMDRMQLISAVQIVLPPLVCLLSCVHPSATYTRASTYTCLLVALSPFHSCITNGMSQRLERPQHLQCRPAGQRLQRCMCFRPHQEGINQLLAFPRSAPHETVVVFEYLRHLHFFRPHIRLLQARVMIII